MDIHSVMALVAPNYIFLALIYLLLFMIVGAVRQEMRQYVQGAGQQPGFAPRQLKLVKNGSDPQWQPGHSFPLQQQTTLGASPDNTIMLGDQFISGHHARLDWDGVKWWIEDLGSKNGTFLNDQRCPPHQPQPVLANAMLRVGDMVFQVQE